MNIANIAKKLTTKTPGNRQVQQNNIGFGRLKMNNSLSISVR